MYSNSFETYKRQMTVVGVALLNICVCVVRVWVVNTINRKALNDRMPALIKYGFTQKVQPANLSLLFLWRNLLFHFNSQWLPRFSYYSYPSLIILAAKHNSFIRNVINRSNIMNESAHSSRILTNLFAIIQLMFSLKQYHS